MPCLWGRHNRTELIISCWIIDATTFDAAAPPSDVGHMNPYRALIDTGADKTMISSQVISDLALEPQGKIPVRGIDGRRTWPDAFFFHVAFMIPLPGQVAAPGAVINAQMYINPTKIFGGEIQIRGGMFDVLLGMDIISCGSLKVDGDGSFSFSF